MFILENRLGGYITNVDNKFTITGNIKKAAVFQTEQKAINVKNSLPKIVKRDTFYVKELSPEVEDKLVEDANYVITGHTNRDDEVVNKIKDMLKEISICENDLKYKEEEYRSRISEIDKELVDIDHWIEFYPVSAYDGYRMTKMRKDRLLERRKIKDSLSEISIIRSIGGGQRLKSLKGIEDKKYTPRILTDIFREKELVKKRREKCAAQ